MQRRARAPRSGRSEGFSLVEMLVVLAIMGLLMALVGPRLFTQVDKSKVQAAEAQVRSLRTSLDTLRLDIGRYPTSEEGLALLLAPPRDQAEASNWYGPYLDGALPLDPWGNAYLYSPPAPSARGLNGSPDIVSHGADGIEGGAGLNADIAA